MSSSASRHLSIDIETRSSADLPSVGVHKYAAAPDFRAVSYTHLPAGAIRIEDNCAHIDGADCLSCGMCAVVCPHGAIHDRTGIAAGV